MKLKLVVVDFELSARVKRIALHVGVPALVLGMATVAYANVPNIFKSGEVLTAAQLNADFALHDTEIAALQADIKALQASAPDGGTSEGGAASGGVIEVLEAEPAAATLDIPSNSGASAYTCPTQSYTPATTGQTALIRVEANALAVPSGSGLGVTPAYNTGAGTDVVIGYTHYAGPFTFTQAHEQLNVSTVTALALTMGTTYVFETAVSDSGGVGFSGVYDCRTTVEIVAAPLVGGPH
jgi:hypothetical protein